MTENMQPDLIPATTSAYVDVRAARLAAAARVLMPLVHARPLGRALLVAAQSVEHGLHDRFVSVVLEYWYGADLRDDIDPEPKGRELARDVAGGFRRAESGPGDTLMLAVAELVEGLADAGAWWLVWFACLSLALWRDGEIEELAALIEEELSPGPRHLM